MRYSPLVAVTASMIVVVFGGAPNAAEPVAPAADARGAVAAAPQNAARPLRGGGASLIGANGAPIVLEVNKGTLIRLPAPAATVFIANPDIADVQVKSPSLIYISAKAPGETVIYAVDATDRSCSTRTGEFNSTLSRLRSSLRQLAPGERISADSVDGNLVLSGIASDAGRADKARALAAAIAGEVKGSQVINRMTVATPNQVSLHVRIAEVSLSVLNEIGVNWRKIGSTVNFLTQNPVTIASEAQNFIIVGKQTGQAVTAMVDALAQEGFVTDLAQ